MTCRDVYTWLVIKQSSSGLHWTIHFLPLTSKFNNWIIAFTITLHYGVYMYVWSEGVRTALGRRWWWWRAGHGRRGWCAGARCSPAAPGCRPRGPSPAAPSRTRPEASTHWHNQFTVYSCQRCSCSNLHVRKYHYWRYAQRDDMYEWVCGKWDSLPTWL